MAVTCERCLGGTHVRCKGRFDSPCACNVCGSIEPIGRRGPYRKRERTSTAAPRKWDGRDTNGKAGAPLDEDGKAQARQLVASGIPVLTVAKRLGTSRYHVKKAVQSAQG